MLPSGPASARFHGHTHHPGLDGGTTAGAAEDQRRISCFSILLPPEGNPMFTAEMDFQLVPGGPTLCQ